MNLFEYVSSHESSHCFASLTILKAEAYSEPSQTYKMDLFAKIVIGFQPFTIFAKNYILDI